VKSVQRAEGCFRCYPLNLRVTNSCKFRRRKTEARHDKCLSRRRFCPLRLLTDGMVMISKSVLLVEDNDDNRAIFGTLLEHVGYTVTRARTGEEALEFLALHRPHIILLDISLPKLDGWAVAERIKANPATAGIPLVALTAHAYPSDRELAREIGFTDYLTKPVEPREVAACVKRLIGDPPLLTVVPLAPAV
jgi:two-component system, cell cycle response regulator DivK